VSLEELQNDYNAIQTKIDTLGPLTSAIDLVNLLKNDVAPSWARSSRS
jgi:hypothetical protein